MYFYTSRLVLFLGNNVFSMQAYHYYFQAIMYFLQANYYYFPGNNVFSIQADQFFLFREILHVFGSLGIKITNLVSNLHSIRN